MVQHERIRWIDVVRCFGIYLIYTAHFGHSAGFLFDFAFTHHVSLFFIISGCMENLSRDEGILRTAWKTLKNILLPWLFYAILSVAVDAQVYYRTTELIPSALVIAKGTIRNQFLAGSVWFLTCIASVRILFSVLRKLKNRWLILLACLCVFVFAEYGMPYRLWQNPKLPYNVDSALYYIGFYGIGYAVFPWMCCALEPKKSRDVVFLRLSGLITGMYTVLLLFGKNLLLFLPAPLSTGPMVDLFCPLIVTYFYCILAKQLENVTILNVIGQNTLHLCGNEYIVKALALGVFGALGLRPDVDAPLPVCIYNAILLIGAVYLLIPAEKKLLKKMTDILSDPFGKKKFGQ